MHLLRRHSAAFSASIGGWALTVVWLLQSGPAAAQQPRPWEIGMQPAFSPVKAEMIWLHDLVMWIITLITIFVAGLLGWVCYRYNAKRNPVPSRVTHHTAIEVAWTVLPILILVGIAIPSFRLVYYEDRTFEPDMTIKVTGHQWYWEYTYPDGTSSDTHAQAPGVAATSGQASASTPAGASAAEPIDFPSYIIPEDKLQPGQKRLLDVDNQLVLPVGKKIRILATSGDVIHSFFIPSLGVQRYAIPGRTIETWVEITAPGDYYGECNQVCGTNHSQMPISIHAVSPTEFQTWLQAAKTKFSQADTPAPIPGPTGNAQVKFADIRP